MRLMASAALRRGLLYGGSIALMKGISLLMLPFIAHHLTEQEFGRLEVASSLAIIGSILVGLGLEDALYRFCGAEQDQHKRHQQAGAIYSLTLIISVLVAPLAWLLAPTLSALLPGEISSYQISLVLLMLALEGSIAVPLGWLRMRDQAGTFFLVTCGRALIQALLTLLFLFNGGGVDQVLEAGVIAALAQAVILAIWQIKDCGLGLDKNLSLQILGYSWPIVISGLMAFALNGMDRMILAEYASLVDVAHFGVAAKFALATVLLLQPYGMWWMPKRFEILFGVNGQEQAVSYTQLGLALTLILAVAVGLGAPLLIDWLLPGSYAMAAQYSLLLVLAAAFKEMSELLNLGCFIGKSTRMQMLINAINAVVGLLLMFLLAPMYAVWGVITALALTQGLRTLMFYLISQKLHPLPYKGKAILILTFLAAFWLSTGMLVEDNWQHMALALAASISMLFSAILLGLAPGINSRSRTLQWI